jgi:hypothetical protein
VLLDLLIATAQEGARALVGGGVHDQVERRQARLAAG